jgi:hypothetical protein
MINRRAFLQLLASIPLAAKALPAAASFDSTMPQVVDIEAILPPDFPTFIPGLKRIGPMTMKLSSPPADPGALLLGDRTRMNVSLMGGERFEFDGFVTSVLVEPDSTTVTVQPTGELVVSKGILADQDTWNGQKVVSVSGPTVHCELHEVTSHGMLALGGGGSFDDYDDYHYEED